MGMRCNGADDVPFHNFVLSPCSIAHDVCGYVNVLLFLVARLKKINVAPTVAIHKNLCDDPTLVFSASMAPRSCFFVRLFVERWVLMVCVHTEY